MEEEPLRRELLELIASSSDGLLPSMAELRRRLRVGMHPLSRALHRLRDEGVLRFMPGGCMRIVGRHPPGPTATRPMKPSWQRLFFRLREEIESGVLEQGRALPKLQFQAINHGLSLHTVHRAYEALANGRWVHRQGRRFLAGPAPRPSEEHGRPSLLLVEPEERVIRDLANPRTGPFLQSVLREAQVSGTRLIRITLSRNPNLAFRTLDGVVEHLGERELLRLIRGLGDRYLGAAGLVLLAMSVLPLSGPSLAVWALGLFVAAALGGFVLFAYHLRGQAFPSTVVLVHGGVAVFAFALLLAFWLR